MVALRPETLSRVLTVGELLVDALLFVAVVIFWRIAKRKHPEWLE